MTGTTLAAAALLGMSAGVPNPDPKPELALRISLDKKAYRPGDPVVLRIAFTNVGGAPLYLTGNHLFPEGIEIGPQRPFELLVTDAAGTELRFWGQPMSEGGTYWKVVRVAPREEFRAQNVLSAGSFATAATDKRHRLGIDSRKYRVRLRYVPPRDVPVHAPPKDFNESQRWQGTILSNEVELRFE